MPPAQTNAPPRQFRSQAIINALNDIRLDRLVLMACHCPKSHGFSLMSRKRDPQKVGINLLHLFGAESGTATGIYRGCYCFGVTLH